MKRAITVIIIIIIIVAVIITGAWLFARRTAQKNGNAPLSFRQFLTGQTSTNPNGPNGGTDTSVFVDDSLNNNPTPGSDGGSTIGTNVSQFTNGTTTPNGTAPNGTPLGGSSNGSGGGNNGSASGQGAGSGTGAGGTNGAGSGTDNPITVPPLANTQPDCTDADLNITFTPDEQAKLQELQKRFYAVAQTLRTDGDAATELSNFDGFTLKQQQLKGLLTYCTNTISPKITNPIYKKKVPTPFWFEPLEIRDNTSYWFGYDPDTDTVGTERTASGVPLGYIMDSGQIGELQEGTADKANGVRSLERVLRLNLW